MISVHAEYADADRPVASGPTSWRVDRAGLAIAWFQTRDDAELFAAALRWATEVRSEPKRAE